VPGIYSSKLAAHQAPHGVYERWFDLSHTAAFCCSHDTASVAIIITPTERYALSNDILCTQHKLCKLKRSIDTCLQATTARKRESRRCAGPQKYANEAISVISKRIAPGFRVSAADML
jgi:hypothetical protein